MTDVAARKPEPLIDDGDYMTTKMVEEHARWCGDGPYDLRCVHIFPLARKFQNWGLHPMMPAPLPDESEEAYWRRITAEMDATALDQQASQISGRPRQWVRYLAEQRRHDIPQQEENL